MLYQPNVATQISSNCFSAWKITLYVFTCLCITRFSKLYSALDICGEAVERNFKQWAVAHITEDGFASGQIDPPIEYICRRFSDAKQTCGEKNWSSPSWSIRCHGLREHKAKGFTGGFITIPKYVDIYGNKTYTDFLF